jgi:hypothetical protein
MSANCIFTVRRSATQCIVGSVRLKINSTFKLRQAYVKFPCPYFYNILRENILQSKPALSKISPCKSIGLQPVLTVCELVEEMGEPYTSMIINDDQQEVTIFDLLISNLLYMFRATLPPIIRST